jgi:hypothetical protein
MGIFDNLKLIPLSNEAGWHKSIERSFLFVSPASMRVAADELIIELYREVFFEKRSGDGKYKKLNPEEQETEEKFVFEDSEKYSLYMARGREFQNNTQNNHFYTPLYPSLARSSWPRKQNERVLQSFFFRAIAQHIQGDGGSNQDLMSNFIDKFYVAFAGSAEKKGEDIAGLEIDFLNGCIEEREAKDNIGELCGTSHLSRVGKKEKKIKSIFTLQDGSDPLARTIFEDLGHLLALEEYLDRLQWMNLMKTFLRLSSSVWLMAQMKMTVVLRDELINILSNRYDPKDDAWIDKVVKNRMNGLFTPTMTPAKHIDGDVKEYVRARIELNILVSLVEKYTQDDWSEKTITLHGIANTELGILQLLTKADNIAGALKKDLDFNKLTLRTALTRHCERYPGWEMKKNNQPLKGYSEFLRVLRKMDKGDEDGGYLVIPDKKVNTGYRIFPGNLMLKLITYLANCKKPSNKKLILADVEKHFSRYGVDFGEKGDMRDNLIVSLQEMGILKGSPDAGDGVSVRNPFQLKKYSRVKN